LRDISFGRWLWTRADVVNQGEFLSWDTESANTHPQNYRWWKPQQREHQNDGNMITVEQGGLYEIQIGFFINMAMTQHHNGFTDIRSSQIGLSPLNKSVPSLTQTVSPIKS